MQKFFERLLRPDYDVNLISKMDRKTVGVAYKNSQKWFSNWLIVFSGVFLIILVGYMKAWDGYFGKDWEAITELQVVKIVLGAYVIISFTATAFLLWALPRYGRNTKKVVLEYYINKGQELAAILKNGKHIPLSQRSNYWPTLSAKRRQDLILDAYQARVKDGGITKQRTDEFLDLLNKKEVVYSDLPDWMEDSILMYDSLHYWYVDAKERADGYVQALAFKKA